MVVLCPAAWQGWRSQSWGGPWWTASRQKSAGWWFTRRALGSDAWWWLDLHCYAGTAGRIAATNNRTAYSMLTAVSTVITALPY